MEQRSFVGEGFSAVGHPRAGIQAVGNEASCAKGSPALVQSRLECLGQETAAPAGKELMWN